jgi:GNAT superfamily N-acetyltransferase
MILIDPHSLMNDLSNKIRLAEKKDLPELLNLYRELTEDPADKISLIEAEEKLDRIKFYPEYHIYVAELANKIVGTFALLIMDNLAHRGEPSAIVEDVVILKEMQGKGIGKNMMNYAMEISRKKGCYKMVLSSHLRREKAHKFYESLGFKKHGYSFIVEL